MSIPKLHKGDRVALVDASGPVPEERLAKVRPGRGILRTAARGVRQLPGLATDIWPEQTNCAPAI